MILEKGKHKHRDIVTRICDNCGGEKRKTFGSIEQGRKKGSNAPKDYCKKCCYLFRKSNQPKMEKSRLWNGGKKLNDNGYYRIYDGKGKYPYEHKIILENHLGRKISVAEKVHHIDLNKTNNSISNLYLCKDKIDHWSCHQSMEKCAFLLFNVKIWYNFKTKKYTSSKTNCSDSPISLYNVTEDQNNELIKIRGLKFYKERRRDNSGFYLRPTSSKQYKKTMHVMIAEVLLGRSLFASETVHHIDGNTLNNDMQNLTVMTRSEHKICHYSLQYCIAELFLDGIVGFENGKYFLKEEI